ncbi:immunity 49 family protein [Agarivorans aestuarii]|uniref:Immunity 49 family protein n=1 Tax=Agarivorans aestuarii TaxID=1563703 RepID=A0ABU7G6I7_9ALTE|nr:immunity 49 family protein [Agarivorans aestuarii]MEE1675021.1 immunity 49 family protein [Agarivorans aestuarii]
MIKVARAYQHDFEMFPIEDELESPRRRISKIPQNIPRKRDNLLSISGAFVTLARWLAWLPSPEHDQEAFAGLQKAAKMQCAYFMLAQGGEQSQTIEIEGLPTVTWDGKDILRTGFINVTRWMDAYFLAMLVRDQASMDKLANFPVALFRQGPTISGECSHMMVATIVAWHHNQADYPQKLIATMQAINANGEDWAIELAGGIMETMMAATTDMDVNFDEVLAKNLALQEKYDMKNGIPIDAFLSLPLVALAGLRHDNGHAVNVESPMAPRFYIEGTYL